MAHLCIVKSVKLIIMKKSFYKNASIAKIDLLDYIIKTRYPFLYNSVGCEYIHNLLNGLYGESKKTLTQTRRSIATQM